MTSYTTIKSMIESRYLEIKNCGANSAGGGGFRVGNTCARGGKDYHQIENHQEWDHLRNQQQSAASRIPAGITKEEPGSHEWASEVAEKWSGTIEERNAIQQHIRLSNPVNIYLRTGQYRYESDKEDVQSRIAGLDKAFTRPYNTAPQNLIVYRGLHKEALVDEKSFVDRGFPSVSYKPLTSFGTEKGRISIRIPKGFPMIFGSYNEAEMILPRNVKFTKGKDGVWNISIKKRGNA